MHDALTGLPNRTLLRDRLEQAILNAQRANAGLALLIMDLDRFDAAQGYYISRPLVPEDLAAWLVANAQTGTRAANDFEDRRAA